MISVQLCRPTGDDQASIAAAAKVQVTLLVDTGAQRTVVDRAIADGMGLVPIRFEPMVGVSHIPEDCPVYLMTMTLAIGDGLGSSSTLLAFTTEMIGMSTPPQPRPFSGLLGRDFFRFMRLHYDGPGGFVDVHAVSAAGLPSTYGRHKKPNPAKSAGRRAQKHARRNNRR